MGKFVLIEAAEGEPVVSGFSFSNGNCIEVRFIGGWYEIRDTKLEKLSPYWRLTPQQFRRLTRELAFQFVRNQTGKIEFSLSPACVFTSQRLPSLVAPEIDPLPQYRWSLLLGLHQAPNFVFAFHEVTEFYMGIRIGQFPADGPPRRMVHSRPSYTLLKEF